MFTEKKIRIRGSDTGCLIHSNCFYKHLVVAHLSFQVVTEMRATFKVTPASLRQEEIRMEEELLELLHKWDKDLMEVLDNYSVQGMCTNSNQTRANVLVRLRTRDCSSAIILDKDEGNKPSVPMTTSTDKENFTASKTKTQVMIAISHEYLTRRGVPRVAILA